MINNVCIPVGPVHPALKEPIKFKFDVEGEKIVGVDVDMGYNHRGIERAGMERNFVQGLYLAERVCGICSFSHPFAYCRAVENAANIEVPERANYIRSIIAELERVHSHLLWAGVAAHEIGFDSVLFLVWKNREKVLDILEEITGNRINYAMLMIGGVRRDIPDEQRAKLHKVVDYYAETLSAVEEVFMNDKTIQLRTRNVGVLTKEEALALEAVGPTARASGVKKDIRFDQPYAAYTDADVKPVVPEKAVGDVFDRIWVRLEEVKQSLGLITQFVDEMPSGELVSEKSVIKLLADLSRVEGEGIGRHEAPRGEVTHYVLLKSQQTPFTWKMRAPTYNNVMPWYPMFRDTELADAPIIAASIDPCIACADRVTVVTGAHTSELTNIELHKKSLEKTRRLQNG
ncbi:MAG: nickel-dependent hydrogenase large subunit [Candidatus Diapherotrites archaeon]|nr:nickel-dependent hydrogenase large subunit [Candidatus Diapherotrites archaeon]